MGNVMQQAGYMTAHYGKWCALPTCSVMVTTVVAAQQPDTCCQHMQLLQDLCMQYGAAAACTAVLTNTLCVAAALEVEMTLLQLNSSMNCRKLTL
jgi:hypothetical protein